MTLFWLALSCQGPSEEDSASPESALVALDAPRLLRRMSLDLRGVLPAPGELDAVEADPALVDSYRDAYLDDPLFEERLVRLLAEKWLTRIDDFEATYYDYDLEEDQDYAFLRSVGEEPLRVVARVIAEDMPWTEVVVGDWTMADDMLADIWDLERDADAVGWQPTHYTDGRPAVGVLATNGMWWRYLTNMPNMNRARVAAIFDLLLCESILGRPVSFAGTNALDSTAAIREDPYCVGCHSSIEPVAATLFGFYILKDISAYEMEQYWPEREVLGPTLLGVEPGWFGTPISGFAELGYAIANDARFTTCAVEQTAELLLRRDMGVGDVDLLDEVHTEFLTSGLSAKEIYRSITSTEAYRAGADLDDEGEVAVLRMMTSDLLESSVAGLTELDWRRDGYAQMDNDVVGYRLMSGGIDGLEAFATAQDPSITWSLVVKRLMEAGARVAVEHDLEGPVEPLLLSASALSSQPGDAAFDEAVADLRWQLHALRADDDLLADVASLWSDVAAIDGADEAWVTVVSALLRSPEFVSY